MRVLWITEYSDRGERAQINALVEAGVQVSLMCPHHSPYFAHYQQDGFEVIDFAPAKRIDRAAAGFIREFVIKQQIQLVHTFNARAVTATILALRDLPSIRLVAYRGIVGNLSFLDPMSWMRYLNRRIDTIVCVAEAIRQFFLNMRPRFLAVPAERVVTIHKGHDPAWYTDPPADLSAFDIDKSDFVVGCVANARPRKGIHVLVNAMARLSPDVPAVLLLIGNMKSKKIDAQIAACPSHVRVIRAGYCDNAPAMIAACDVGALPSLRREGLPRGVIEAMIQGVPNVVTNTGGSPELIIDGESGLVVPANDPAAMAKALTKLHRDPTLRKAMGIAARERITSEFHYSRTVEKTLALYRRLLGVE